MRELPPAGGSDRDTATAINTLIRGGSNAVGLVTLRANQTTTQITTADRFGQSINAGAHVFFEPRSENAALEKAAGTMWYAIVAGTVTITHANNAQTDRHFSYGILGG